MARSNAMLLLLVSLLALSQCSVFAEFIGGGSSAAPLENQVINSINARYKAGIAAYKNTNSKDGRLGAKSGKYQVGVSITPLTAAERSGFNHFTIPQALVTVSFVSNKAGLRLSAAQIVAIYNGKILKWEQVPGSGLRGTIIPVVRKDAAGTTDLITRYLLAAKVGWAYKNTGEGPFTFGNPNVKYGQGNAGQATIIKANALAFGYAQSGIGVKQFRLQEIAITNAAGKYVKISAGADYLAAVPRSPPAPASPVWAGTSLIYVRGPATFPVVSFVYTFYRPSYVSDGKTGGLVVAFGLYTQTPAAQKFSSAFFFYQIPTKYLVANRAALKSIKLAAGVKLPFNP
eukprot:jgi/Mesen1/5226/ME000026S04527